MSYELIRQLALGSVNQTLTNQAEALDKLDQQYQTSEFSQKQLLQSLDILYKTVSPGNNGKIVVLGIGKSYKIATKILSTLNSLSLHSHVLHPSEALHGDLGVLKDQDCLILLSASGNTPELIQLLPHISSEIPVILLTCSKDSKLSNHPQVKSLLYAELPTHLKEDTIHGVPAPTISTTLSLALADATVLALSEMLEADVLKRKKMFSMKHPGGSIGSDLSHLNDNLLLKASNRGEDEVSNQKASCSSQASSNSLFSLNNLKQALATKSSDTSYNPDSNGSSLASSDDEYSEKRVSIDSNLSNEIQKSQSYQINVDEFSKISEIGLLKLITLYEFIILENPEVTKTSNADDNYVLAIKSSSIRQKFKLQILQEYIPEKFVTELMKDFKKVKLT